MEMSNGKLRLRLDEVLFINTERKTLPFSQASAAKVKIVPTWDDFMLTMNAGCGIDVPKGREDYYGCIKLVVVDSFTRLLYLLSKKLKDAGVRGFDFWKEYAETIERLLMEWQSHGRFIVFTSIDEVVKDGDLIDRRVAKVEGKKLEGLIESFFTIVLHTRFDRAAATQEKKYQFFTNTDGRNTAKSPVGMFETIYIQNDMSLVLGRIHEYYKMSENPDFVPSPILLVGMSGSGKSTSFKYLFEE